MIDIKKQIEELIVKAGGMQRDMDSNYKRAVKEGKGDCYIELRWVNYWGGRRDALNNLLEIVLDDEAKTEVKMEPEPATNPNTQSVSDSGHELIPIATRLQEQDNRCTANPMFCVQIKVRDIGYDSDYCDQLCWRDDANEITVFDDDPLDRKPDTSGDEWVEYGYRDRWETVMVAFTQAGCEEYLRLNGHNDRRQAHNGEVRIYAESFNRCPEMIAIRKFLLLTNQINNEESTKENKS